MKYHLCSCIRPHGNWNVLCLGVSEHVATKMPSVQMFQTTWQIKCPLCKCIKKRGNWNVPCAGVSDHEAIEMLSVWVYQTTWQLTYCLCRCIRSRGKWNAFCVGLSDYVATDVPSVQVYQTTWQMKFPLCSLSEHVATYSKLTFAVRTMKHQILWISISYRRSSCSSVNTKIGDGLCSPH